MYIFNELLMRAGSNENGISNMKNNNDGFDGVFNNMLWYFTYTPQQNNDRLYSSVRIVCIFLSLRNKTMNFKNSKQECNNYFKILLLITIAT